MIPHKGRTNPQHVFIIRKPTPHGLKVWSLVDFSGYFLGFSLFRRGGKKEATHETMARMIRGVVPKGAIAVGDSLFGGLPTARILLKEGYEVLLSCTSQRPSAVFKDHAHKQLSEENPFATLYGTLSDENGEDKAIAFNSFLSKGRIINTISSVFSADVQEHEVEVLIRDEDPDGQQYVPETVQEARPDIRVKSWTLSTMQMPAS